MQIIDGWMDEWMNRVIWDGWMTRKKKNQIERFENQQKRIQFYIDA
jgi:hypothetical protein